MTGQMREMLETFDHLPETDKQVFAVEIIRRTLNYDWSTLSDDTLVYYAEELFQQLDQEEFAHDLTTR